MWNQKKKKGTNELTYKTKIDAPKWKTDLWLSKGKGVGTG